MPGIDFRAASIDVARDLIGASLFIDGVGGRIVETEAYDESEPAAHTFGGRTARNAVMFGAPGRAYVYRSYGIHWCLNFVCMPKGHGAGGAAPAPSSPPAGLLRVRMRRARCGLDDERLLCAGPGRLGQALGVTHALNGLRLDRAPFRVVPRRADAAVSVAAGTRIGISKSRNLPWRFVLAGSRFLSRPMRSS